MSGPRRAGDIAAAARDAALAKSKAKESSGEAPPKRAKVVRLPAWPDAERAIPNHLGRSGVFAPIARGRRKVHVRRAVPSRSDVKMEIWGEQLDEGDCDVWLQALHEARLVPLGEPVLIVRAQFLKAIGRATGKANYLWLKRSIDRLTFAMLTIETKRYTIGETMQRKGLHFIDGFDEDEASDSYLLRIDPRVVAMFANHEFARIDWKKRLQIEHQVDMAKWLQRLVHTSSDREQRYSLEELRERMQYNSPMRKFREALKAALGELARLKIIAKPEIKSSTRGVEQASWVRLAKDEDLSG